MSDLPTGTVTFLFTDLEGSTRLWEGHPEAMKGALASHDELLRELVRENGGHVVKSTGDGMHSAFETAHDAVAAASGAQSALAARAWGATGPLRVRMSLHIDTERVISALARQASSKQNPPISFEQLLDRLAEMIPAFIEEVRDAMQELKARDPARLERLLGS